MDKKSIKKNNDANVMNHELPRKAKVANVSMSYVEWCVLFYTPSIPQQTLPGNEKISRTLTQLSYIERSVSVKDIQAQKNCGESNKQSNFV